MVVDKVNVRARGLEDAITTFVWCALGGGVQLQAGYMPGVVLSILGCLLGHS